MAEGKPTLEVVLSYPASDELDQIWFYNAKHRSVSAANDWDAFLKENIQKLSTEYNDGYPVRGFPEVRYRTCKRSRAKDGHHLIYEIDKARGLVIVLHVFHTKMDVVGRLSGER